MRFSLPPPKVSYDDIVFCFSNRQLCYHQLKGGENCNNHDVDNIEVPQRVLELPHVGRLHASHLSGDEREVFIITKIYSDIPKIRCSCSAWSTKPWFWWWWRWREGRRQKGWWEEWSRGLPDDPPTWERGLSWKTEMLQKWHAWSTLFNGNTRSGR